MKPLFILFSLLIQGSLSLAQVTGYKEDFKDGNLNGWVSDHPRTYQLSVEDQLLKINYTRTTTSDQWDNFNFTPASTINNSTGKTVTVRARSSVQTAFTVKSIYQSGDDFLTVSLPGDNEWHTLSFKSKKTTSLVISKFYLYLDAGTTASKSGAIYVDEIRIGDSVLVSSTLDWKFLNSTVTQAKSRLASAVEGTEDGQFPAGSKSTLQAAITSAETFAGSGAKRQGQIDSAASVLLSAMVDLEKSVIGPVLPIVDPQATWETRNLYRNLKSMATRNLMFGMHDATGYGVGWTGNDNRSDVNDVVGDFPGFYSMDFAFIDKEEDWSGSKYRVESAYNRGGVISFCWHQLDPDKRGFYATDVNNEKIVTSILPGGPRHSEYKAKLRQVGKFLQSIRGSKGENIPVIVRPYHEHIGNWFWWGTGHRTTAEYNSLWRFTVDYLIDSLNVHNMLLAISPNLDHGGNGNSYFDVYPGDDYVDIFGFDFYWSDVISDQTKKDVPAWLRTVASHAVARGKIVGFTEAGQEGLDAPNWFSDILLPPIKYDSLASNLVYAAVWRNANTSHHYAPYPGHKSVPDFRNFYNDAYTLFERDLPDMYAPPATDVIAPSFTTGQDSLLVSWKTNFTISLETNDRSLVKMSTSDVPFDSMEDTVLSSGFGLIHEIPVSATQGQQNQFYLKARDRDGNTMQNSFVLSVLVDTMMAPVKWFDSRYSSSAWPFGETPIGSDQASETTISSVKTAYFRTTFDLDSVPATFALLVKSLGGFVAFLNGEELLRHNINPGPVTYDTPPNSAGTYSRILIFSAAQRAMLRKGTNTIAIEIHAMAPGSVTTFDAKVYTQTSTVIPLGSTWQYVDTGAEPEPKTLGQILSTGEVHQPATFRLLGNYPNPFNPSTTIQFMLARTQSVRLRVFDSLGRLVSEVPAEHLPAGLHSIRWDASGLSSGVYLIRLSSEGGTAVQRAVLLK